MAKITKSNAATSISPAAQSPAAQSNVFGLAVGFVLRKEIEGGYVNDPRDPGGETNFGISKRAYPQVNIAELTEADAVEIYHRDYWQAAKCGEMPDLIAVCVFDAAVNQGVGAAIRLLQRAAGVAADGQIGPKTLAAIHQADPSELMTEYLGWRLHRYANTANAITFMRGWANRVLRLAAFASATFGGAQGNTAQVANTQGGAE